MTTAIGIVCIGQKYQREFDELFRPSVEFYCKKYGYTLHVFTDYIGARHPDLISFQKCLVPSALKQYDRVLVLDADILISPSAPPLPESTKIGVVDEVAQVSPAEYKAISFASPPIQYYKMAGFDLKTTRIFNTGLLLTRPALHAVFLEGIFNSYAMNSIGHPRGFHYEQSCVGYELQINDMYELLDNKWNWIVCLKQAPAYFAHFAGLGLNRKSAINNYNLFLTTHRAKGGLRWGIQK